MTNHIYLLIKELRHTIYNSHLSRTVIETSTNSCAIRHFHTTIERLCKICISTVHKLSFVHSELKLSFVKKVYPVYLRNTYGAFGRTTMSCSLGTVQLFCVIEPSWISCDIFHKPCRASVGIRCKRLSPLLPHRYKLHRRSQLSATLARSWQ